MADANPAENGSALEVSTAEQLGSEFIQNPAAFAKKAEDLIARVIAELLVQVRRKKR